MKEALDKLYAEQGIDQSLMGKESSFFFHAGMRDEEATPAMTDMNLKYFQERGVTRTKVVKSKYFGHWFPDSMPAQATNFMLENVSQISGLESYKDTKALDPNWRTNGIYGKFDQNNFALSVNKDYNTDALALRKWGFYYYPNECVTVDPAKPG